MLRNALVTGATGLVGRELIKHLLKTSYYNSIHVVGRKEFPLEHEKIKSYVVDFNNLSDLNPEVIIHDVYICLGTTIKKAGTREKFRQVDYQYVINIGKWAKSKKIARVAFISSVGANPASKNFYLRVKGDAEKSLQELSFSRLIIMRPSLLLGKREEFRFAESVFSLLGRPFLFMMRGKLRKYKPIQGRKVAHMMLSSVINSEKKILIVENSSIENSKL